MTGPDNELPPIETGLHASVQPKLRLFRNTWGPTNPAFGDAKWKPALGDLQRATEAIDKLSAESNWEASKAARAFRAEIDLALQGTVPRSVSEELRSAREDLELYLEMSNE